MTVTTIKHRNIPPKVRPGFEHIAEMIETTIGPRCTAKSQAGEMAITITNMLASAGEIQPINAADHAAMRA